MNLPHALHVAEINKAGRGRLRLVAVFFLVFAGLCQSNAVAQIGVMPMDMGDGRITLVPTLQPQQMLPYGRSYGAPIPLPGVPLGVNTPYGAPSQPAPSGIGQQPPPGNADAPPSTGSVNAARPGRDAGAPSSDRGAKSAVEAAAPRLLSVGDRLSGAATVGRDGSLMVNGTRVLLDGANLLPAMELCGNGVQMYRCGQIGAALAETMLARIPRLRCLALTAQSAPNAAVTAWCQAGRDDVAALLVRAGAARAADVRQQAWQMEAQSDQRGIWAGGVGR